MTCPGCGTDVAAETAICPHCDFIIDAGFLAPEEPSADEPDDDSLGDAPPAEDRTRIQAAPQRPIPRPISAEVDPDATPPRGTQVTPPRRAARDANLEPLPPGAFDHEDFGEHPERLWLEVKAFAASLSLADRIAASGALALALSCFLPWKETSTDGEFVGLFGLGALAFLAAAAQIAALAARHRGSENFSGSVLWGAQLCAAGFAVFWCIDFLRTAKQTVPSESVGAPDFTSQPSYGLWLGLVSAVIALAGALLHVREGASSHRA